MKIVDKIRVTVEVQLSKPIADVHVLIAQRAHGMDGIEEAVVVDVEHVEHDGQLQKYTSTDQR